MTGISRRPIQFWKVFNNWWRGELDRLGRRPIASEINDWYEQHAEHTWAPDNRPTMQETRVHAKCLRSVDAVRVYFRKYRAHKRREPDTPDDEDADPYSSGEGAASGSSYGPSSAQRPVTRTISATAALEGVAFRTGFGPRASVLQPPRQTISSGSTARKRQPKFTSLNAVQAGSPGDMPLKRTTAPYIKPKPGTTSSNSQLPCSSQQIIAPPPPPLLQQANGQYRCSSSSWPGLSGSPAVGLLEASKPSQPLQAQSGNSDMVEHHLHSTCSENLLSQKFDATLPNKQVKTRKAPSNQPLKIARLSDPGPYFGPRVVVTSGQKPGSILGPWQPLAQPNYGATTYYKPPVGQASPGLPLLPAIKTEPQVAHQMTGGVPNYCNGGQPLGIAMQQANNMLTSNDAHAATTITTTSGLRLPPAYPQPATKPGQTTSNNAMSSQEGGNTRPMLQVTQPATKPQTVLANNTLSTLNVSSPVANAMMCAMLDDEHVLTDAELKSIINELGGEGHTPCALSNVDWSSGLQTPRLGPSLTPSGQVQQGNGNENLALMVTQSNMATNANNNSAANTEARKPPVSQVLTCPPAIPNPHVFPNSLRPTWGQMPAAQQNAINSNASVQYQQQPGLLQPSNMANMPTAYRGISIGRAQPPRTFNTANSIDYHASINLRLSSFDQHYSATLAQHQQQHAVTSTMPLPVLRSSAKAPVSGSLARWPSNMSSNASGSTANNNTITPAPCARGTLSSVAQQQQKAPVSDPSSLDTVAGRKYAVAIESSHPDTRVYSGMQQQRVNQSDWRAVVDAPSTAGGIIVQPPPQSLLPASQKPRDSSSDGSVAIWISNQTQQPGKLTDAGSIAVQQQQQQFKQSNWTVPTQPSWGQRQVWCNDQALNGKVGSAALAPCDSPYSAYFGFDLNESKQVVGGINDNKYDLMARAPSNGLATPLAWDIGSVQAPNFMASQPEDCSGGSQVSIAHMHPPQTMDYARGGANWGAPGAMATHEEHSFCNIFA